jgi:hypothetical protein
MPQTSSASATSSSRCSNNSEHFPYRYVNLEHVMDAFSQRENIATAINLTHNNRTAFTEIAFLNYLFQNIRRKEIQLEKDRRLARARIVRLLSKNLPTNCINGSSTLTLILPFIFQLDHHIPLQRHTSSISHSSHSPEPKPVKICQHTCSEINEINHH